MSEFGDKPKIYEESKPTIGPRTTVLLNGEPQLKSCDPIRILSLLLPGVSRAIVMLPGGLDMKPDEDTFRLAKTNQLSAVMVRYPNKPAFSLRREVAETLDYLEDSHVSEVDIMTGSYGGVPALMAMYSALEEGESGVKIRSFFAVKAALQPSDLQASIRNLSRATFGLEEIVGVPLRLGRGIRARINAPDIKYPDRSVLEKIVQVPAMFIVPPGKGDLLVRITGSYKKYFPNAQIIEDSGARFDPMGLVTWGHMSPGSEEGLRILQEAFLDNPNIMVRDLPEGYKRIK